MEKKMAKDTQNSTFFFKVSQEGIYVQIALQVTLRSLLFSQTRSGGGWGWIRCAIYIVRMDGRTGQSASPHVKKRPSFSAKSSKGINIYTVFVKKKYLM